MALFFFSSSCRHASSRLPTRPASFPFDRGMFGALHVLRQEPTYATALTETDGVAYTLVSESDPSFFPRSTSFSPCAPNGWPCCPALVCGVIGWDAGHVHAGAKRCMRLVESRLLFPCVCVCVLVSCVLFLRIRG